MLQIAFGPKLPVTSAARERSAKRAEAPQSVMAKKPPPWDQPTLFPLNPTDSPTPEKPVNSTTNGDDHAVQDHSSRTSERTDGAARAATPDPQALADDGNLRTRTEGQPRNLDGD